MQQIIYSSAAVAPFDEAELTELLRRARKNNERLGVTGMLLYHDGSFLQAIEGAQPVLTALFEVIVRDKRHHRAVTVLKREIEERHFGDWAMGFVSPKDLPRNLPGYSDYLGLRDRPAESGNAAERVLMAFRQGRFRSYVAA